MFSDIQDLARIEYYVTDLNRTGYLRPYNPRYDTMLRESFEVIADTTPRTPLRIFGIRITKGPYGFGTLVLRRTGPSLRK